MIVSPARGARRCAGVAATRASAEWPPRGVAATAPRGRGVGATFSTSHCAAFLSASSMLPPYSLEKCSTFISRIFRGIFSSSTWKWFRNSWRMSPIWRLSFFTRRSDSCSSSATTASTYSGDTAASPGASVATAATSSLPRRFRPRGGMFVALPGRPRGD